MKLGILNAIHPQKSQINWGGSPVTTYIHFIESASDTFQYAGYEVAQGELPTSPEACDAYIISGSPRGVYDQDPWIPELSQFIRDSYSAGKKLVGICFGHQILAHALGGHAEKSEKGWGLGLSTFNITKSKPWMTDEPQQCTLYFAHQDQVMRPPPEAEILGGNDFCPFAFYTIDNRVFAIQGHPEFSRGIMEDILARAEGTVDPQRRQAAIQSLNNGTPDNSLVAKWVVNFLVDKPGKI